jgi:hypothetical protein
MVMQKKTGHAGAYYVPEIVQRIDHNVTEQSKGARLVDMLQEMPDDHVHALNVSRRRQYRGDYMVVVCIDVVMFIRTIHALAPLSIDHVKILTLPRNPRHQHPPKAALSIPLHLCKKRMSGKRATYVPIDLIDGPRVNTGGRWLGLIFR